MITTVTSDYRYHDYNCNKWLSLPWLQLLQVTIVTMISPVTSDYRYHDYNCNKWLSLPWLQL